MGLAKIETFSGNDPAQRHCTLRNLLCRRSHVSAVEQSVCR